MGNTFPEIHSLFDRLAADPRSIVAFEDYARAVEAAIGEENAEDAPKLAETLAQHLEELPALAESRLEGSIDWVSNELDRSLELEEARKASHLKKALKRAREQLEVRHPRVDGRSPEEFVHLNRHQPFRILDHLEVENADWLKPYLERSRSHLRHSQDTPGDPSTDSALASTLADLGELLENLSPRGAAEVAYRTALLYDPGQPAARAGLGHLALSFGRAKEAELELRAALDRDEGHPRSLAGLCELLLKDNRTDEAGPLIDRLLSLHPHRPEGHLLAATRELASANLASAVSHLLDATEIDPDHPRPLRMLANTYAEAGYKELAEAYQDASLRRSDASSVRPDFTPVAETQTSLPATLLRPPPAPLLTQPALEPGGPLTRREAFGRILAASLQGENLSLENSALVLRARSELRISRKDFQELYAEALSSSAPNQDPLDPVALFEELRKRAWRDGYLSSSERNVLESALNCLGIDRRKKPRPRSD